MQFKEILLKTLIIFVFLVGNMIDICKCMQTKRRE